MFNGPVVLVIDNASIHSGLEEIVQEPKLGNHPNLRIQYDCLSIYGQSYCILKLGPYSPMLNPIESAWSAFKAEVKRLLVKK